MLSLPERRAEHLSAVDELKSGKICYNFFVMKLESYFDFLADDDIRIKGSRIGIESVLYEYIYRNKSAEEIADQFPSITPEQIYATILYYLGNRESTEKYLLNWLNFSRKMRDEQAKNPSPIVMRLRKLKAEKNQPIAA